MFYVVCRNYKKCPPPLRNVYGCEIQHRVEFKLSAQKYINKYTALPIVL